MDELLDLVNENDEVIGEVWKSKANADPKLIHREILVYLFDKDNRLLMQQRSFKKKVYPGVWAETAAGHVGKGEKPETAAHRELKEEMGFDTPLLFIGKKFIYYPNETHITYCYKGEYQGEEIIIDHEEVEAVKFFPRESLEQLYDANDPALKTEIDLLRDIWKK